LRRSLAIASILALVFESAEGEFVGAAVLPHGDFAYAPQLVRNENGSAELHKAALHAGSVIASWDLDMLILSTPHAIADSVRFALYANTNGSGYAAVGQDLHNASFPIDKVPLHASLAPAQVRDLQRWLLGELGAPNITMLEGFGDGDDMPLRWAEVIPLSFIGATVNDSKPLPPDQRRTKVLIVSQPLRRYNDSVAMVPELLRVGESMGRWLQSFPGRAAFVVSADLAHTHGWGGYEPYGSSPAAEPFDEACGAWASTLDPAPLLKTASSLADDALSCGFTGMVMLHGALTAGGGGIAQWTPTLLAAAHPTYYGMMVALMELRARNV